MSNKRVKQPLVLYISLVHNYFIDIFRKNTQFFKDIINFKFLKTRDRFIILLKKELVISYSLIERIRH